MRVGDVCCWVVLAAWLPPVFATETSSSILTERHSQGWRVVETANFRCWSQLGSPEARELAEACEVWRKALRDAWLTDGLTEPSWTPRCDVIVYPTQHAYGAALGRPQDTSVGSTSLKFDGDRVTHRRIDLRADAVDWSNAALPHELTHVVLGDRFAGRPLPKWADEGMAMLAESSAKREFRRTHLAAMLSRHPGYQMSDLVRVDRLPPAEWRDAFYGQSAALVTLLVERKSSQVFAACVEDSLTLGLEASLRKHYDLAHLAALQAEWQQAARQPRSLMGSQFVGEIELRLSRRQPEATVSIGLSRTAGEQNSPQQVLAID